MSYGTNAPQGLVPQGHLLSLPYTARVGGALRIASGYNTNIFAGDLVVLGTGGTLELYNTTPGTGKVVGVFNGVRVQVPSSVNPVNPYQFFNMWTAGTITYDGLPAQAEVYVDPFILYSIQTDSAVGFAESDIDAPNYQITTGSRSASYSLFTGQSTTVLAQASAATTATLPLKAYAIDPTQGNAYGTPYNNVLVLINNHQYKGGNT